MKKAFILGVIIFFSQFVYGQKDIEQLDSVYQYIISHEDDVSALYKLNSGLNYLFYDYYDTCYYYSAELVKYAELHNEKELIVRGHNLMGMCVEFAGYLDSAITIYKEAARLAEKHVLPATQGDVYNNLGIAYSFKGQYEYAIEYAFKALKISEDIKDTSRILIQRNNIGLRYSELGNSLLAIENYKIGLALYQQSSMSSYSSIFFNLGREYLLTNQFDSAIIFYQLGLELAKDNELNYRLGEGYMGIAATYVKQKRFTIANVYLDSVAIIIAKTNDEPLFYEHKLFSSLALINSKEYKQALQYLLEVNNWYETHDYDRDQVQVFEKIANTYHDLEQSDSAFKYMALFANAKDSIFGKQRDQASLQLRSFRESKMQKEIEFRQLETENQKTLKNYFVVIGILLFLLVLGIASRFHFVNKTKKALAHKNTIIQKEKDRSDELLLNILPAEVAEELKEKGKTDARDFDMVSILFTDFKGFTAQSEKLTAAELVHEINHCFEAFDHIIERYQVEKIKTIGDSYMAAGGIPVPTNKPIKNTVLAALEMQEFITKRKAEQDAVDKPAFEMRVGIHTGPVVAGIVGVKKFQYDIWGDTVNTASRMESNGEVGKVNISQTTYELLKDDADFTFESRGKIEVKGKGELIMYFVSPNVPQ